MISISQHQLVFHYISHLIYPPSQPKEVWLLFPSLDDVEMNQHSRPWIIGNTYQSSQWTILWADWIIQRGVVDCARWNKVSDFKITQQMPEWEVLGPNFLIPPKWHISRQMRCSPFPFSLFGRVTSRLASTTWHGDSRVARGEGWKTFAKRVAFAGSFWSSLVTSQQLAKASR